MSRVKYSKDISEEELEIMRKNAVDELRYEFMKNMSADNIFTVSDYDEIPEEPLTEGITMFIVEKENKTYE